MVWVEEGINIHQSTIHILCCDFLESVCCEWYTVSESRYVSEWKCSGVERAMLVGEWAAYVMEMVYHMEEATPRQARFTATWSGP